MTIQLTKDQENAYAAIMTLMTTSQQVLVIEGGAGVGKTTLMNVFMDEWDQLVSISGGAFKAFDLVMTATTNKAADALANATGREVSTIHSFLGLVVMRGNYGKTALRDSGRVITDGQLVVIDEASFIDRELLAHIQHKLRGCKIIFLGDPHQLRPVGALDTPVFNSGFTTVRLTQIVRQSDDSPIQELSRGLRSLVEDGVLPTIPVDGHTILHMPQQDFEAAFIQDVLNNPVNSVRALAWTNKQSQYYNAIISQAKSGNSDFGLGDIVTVNKQHKAGNFRFATDSTFYVTGIGNWYQDSNGITMRKVESAFGVTVNQAANLDEVRDAVSSAYADGSHSKGDMLSDRYADLRLMYASTVNKSQGSTYDTVYVDLNDIGRCRDRDQVHRMLYVATSRAKHKVVYTGDI